MLRSIALSALVLAATACAPRGPTLSCAPPQGAEALLAGAAPVLVVGSEAAGGAGALTAAVELACARAQSGGATRVLALDPLSSALPVAAARANTLRAAGADLALERAAVPAGGPERAEAAARAVVALRGSAPGTALIVVGTPEDAARAPVGLSGETWPPLAARLAVTGPVIALRMMPRTQPGAAVRLATFEDVPAEGAPLVFDGTLEAGPPAAAPS